MVASPLRFSYRFAARFVFTLVLGALTLGCEPTSDPSPRIEQTSPALVVQTKTLTIVGAGFGTFAPGWSGVLINGSCAPVSVWDEHKIVAVVPPGVGLGLKRLTVLRGDGARAIGDVVIAGVDIPSHSIGCELNSFLVDYDRPDVSDEEPGLTDVTVDVAPADGDALIDDGFVAACSLAIANGACNNDWDCPIVANTAQMGDTVFSCLLGCESESDPLACNSRCLSTTLNLTDPCASCHAQYSECVLASCINECVIDSQSASCVDCRNAFCDVEYQGCTGLGISF